MEPRSCYNCGKEIFNSICGDPVVAKDHMACVGPYYPRWVPIKEKEQIGLSQTGLKHSTVTIKGGDVMMVCTENTVLLSANIPGRVPPVYHSFIRIDSLWKPYGVVINGLQPGKKCKIRSIEIHITEEEEDGNTEGC